MTKEDIIRMAREAGGTGGGHWVFTLNELERFAALVAAAEREACAKVCEDSDHVVGGKGYYDQLGDADATVRNIATAIRARGVASIRGETK